MKIPKWKKVSSEPAQDLICFVPVNKSNWKECANLPTGEDHKFVAPNVWSIAAAQFWSGSRSCCIYHGDEMVGYILFNLSYNDAGELQLWGNRLMIAELQRGKGYGRAAIQQCIAEARQQDCVEVGLSTGPENYKAIRLYESLGFQSTGKFLGDEMIYICPLANS
jgi:GNAT superfamily N-acetyltransferase